MAGDFALDTVEGLSEAIQASGMLNSGRNVEIAMKPFVSGALYCGRCRGLRRVRISSSALFDLTGSFYNGINLTFKVGPVTTPVPALFIYSCIQCDAMWSVLVYPGIDGIRIALLPVHFSVGGIASEHTPAGVAFYLDQAGRCHYIGANSAAIAMFRSALEWILEECGFAEKMLLLRRP